MGNHDAICRQTSKNCRCRRRSSYCCECGGMQRPISQNETKTHSLLTLSYPGAATKVYLFCRFIHAGEHRHSMKYSLHLFVNVDCKFAPRMHLSRDLSYSNSEYLFLHLYICCNLLYDVKLRFIKSGYPVVIKFKIDFSMDLFFLCSFPRLYI